ncbi:glycosyltransferase [Phaeovulum sp. W22_SRMD_FR3]|uniref:glycosyltransferase n=1 Tax=Phaeovulum sp. W22_SRMD_FR3 TaxID=3240274 RepID=UPI003F977A3C
MPTCHRIAFYLPSFHGGGAERNTGLIASELAARGFPVLIVVDRDQGPNRALLHEQVEVQVLSGGNRAHIGGLARVLQDWKADVVFARLGLCPLIAVMASKMPGASFKVIISYHNPYDPQTFLGVKVTWWLSSILSRLSHATIVVSTDIKKEIATRYWASSRKITVIFNPVNLAWVAERSTQPLPAIYAGKPFILAAGRLVDQKDYPTLLKAFAEVSKHFEHDLVIIGEGPRRPLLESMISELGLTGRAHLAGYQENPFPFYRRAALFALASRAEGFGNVLVEALAVGTTIVATNCPGGPKEILDYGAFGALVKVGDSKALAAAIVEELRNQRDSDALQRRALDFALPKIVDSYLAII